ncbi:BT_3928 family protein [Bacteroidota bacterium]
MTRNRIIPILLIVARILVGLVFIFSGFVKGVDPMGSAYKFSDYFNAFNMGFLEPVALVLSFVLSTAEFLIGISLIFRFRIRLGAWTVAVFIVFFTILTFILALTNPVSDCGCFGDAIIMTNWETFFKNLILLPFVLIIFLYRKEQIDRWPSFYSWSGLLVFCILLMAIEVNAYRHLPMMDFRPYSIGTHIPDKMTAPEGTPQDVYQTLLYYEKNGEVQEFTEDNFPWEDTTWTFVDSEHALISKGYEPPIHDFTITDENGYDYTGDILNDDGYSFLFISTHLEKADMEALRYADELASWCIASGYSFYCLTASTQQNITNVREKMDLGFDFYATDEITLKTIVRANPGLLLLKQGTILGKWHYNDFPQFEKTQDSLMALTLTQYGRALEKRSLGIFISLFLLVSTLIVYSPFSRNMS